MPEYLTPGVYVEETSFRSRSIEGVPTSTCGMAGLTAYGPVPYRLDALGVTMTPKPTLVTSFTEFERAFGGLDAVGLLDNTTNYLAHAARAFFGNGGRRLYVQRVYPFATAGNPATIDLTQNFAFLPLGAGGAGPVWRARWPGRAGNGIQVRVRFRRSKNVLVSGSLTGVSRGAAVEIGDNPAQPPADNTAPDVAKLKIVALDQATGKLGYVGNNGAFEPVDPAKGAFHITFDIEVVMGTRADVYTGVELGSAHPRGITKVLQAERPADEFSLVWLDTSVPQGQPALTDGAILTALLSLKEFTFLTGGTEGAPLTPDDLKGRKSSPDDARDAATGLAALGEIEDIAIVTAPDIVRLDADSHKVAADYLIQHCEELRYRIAIVDPPGDSSISSVRAFRSQFDTTHGALYYPWLRVLDPTAKRDPGAPPATMELPPSGATAGIYARSDIERGVHKAPANEVVLGITEFAANVTFDRQSVLNPEGINALRFFPGRANRVWGARTMSSDPEWKYVNVRRLFIYLEHSIDKSTQWVVFEPNNERLWASVRQTIEDFLLVTWRSGALMGTKPEEAYFVRCDRTTMSQNDLDNGRLICDIGVAPTYPAEFVIFRIGQWTADARQS
ncbi:phage tail sheath family protein [Longispora albida]|uniref:phage tail sheath family protein n=1 Tax=Longispora albida TaxID=203523 RepID=UPI0003719656|nr:phage tail sheath subtilisin-like domain-containing protein [Longispora albida]